MTRSIVLWLGPTATILTALACATPGVLQATQCVPEPVPDSSAGAAFQRGCDQRAAGHYSEAIREFREAARLWHENRNVHWEARSRVFVGSTQLQLFQYVAALETSEAAAALAASAGEKEIAAGANGNIATIYAQLGNFSIARQRLQEAIEDLKHPPPNHAPRNDLLAQAYYLLSYQQIRFGETEEGIRNSALAIKTAEMANKPQFEAAAWDFRGTAFLLTNRLDDATSSLKKAEDLYQATSKSIPSATLEHLAELKWKQKQNEAALRYVEQAYKNPDPRFKTNPQYYPLTVRAAILRDMGRTDEALATYRQAIHSANTWRRFALPGDTTNIETVKQLNNTYQSFAELAAAQSLQRHDEALASEAFEALAQNRSASLREQSTLEMGRNQALPADYLAKLGELQSVQARVTLGGDAEAQARLAELETEIGEIETRIGLPAEKNSFSAERNPARNSLRDIQSGLGTTEALLSFSLGAKESFLWAVTRDTMNLYRLPAANEIGRQVQDLRDAVEHHQAFSRPSRNLGDDLFSQLSATFWQKPDWLIVGDGALLDRVPFAVLPTKDPHASDTLLRTHTIRLLPSELLLLAKTPKAANPRFLGIADPLYNLADSRRRPQPVLLNANNTKSASALGRLPGSQREIRAAAHSSGMSQNELLIGPDANLATLTAALSQDPAIIHLAVHVVSPTGHPEQAALALSLGPDNIPEFLTREKIASLRVPGSLVVLSGCSSGQGQPVPSAGLIGLSRAWLLAGASVVVVSNWPTPDDSGQFFTSFYSYLADAGSGSLAKRAASALQKAQLQMQQHGGYAGAPAFWAAYSVVSKE